MKFSSTIVIALGFAIVCTTTNARGILVNRMREKCHGISPVTCAYRSCLTNGLINCNPTNRRLDLSKYENLVLPKDFGLCKDENGNIHSLGEVYKHDCNSCTCTVIGPMCTLMGCFRNLEKLQDDREQIIENNISKSGCADSNGTVHDWGTSWRDECNNICWCLTGASRATCTLRGCRRKVEKLQGDSEPMIENKTCKDWNGNVRNWGTSWTHEDGCNRCWCTAGASRASCTLMGCLRNFEKLQDDSEPMIENKTCKDWDGNVRNWGTSWDHEDGCNRCWCTAGASRASCTIMGCLRNFEKLQDDSEPMIENKTCKDWDGNVRNWGTSWTHEDGCNRCWCAAGSSRAKCTMKGCWGL